MTNVMTRQAGSSDGGSHLDRLQDDLAARPRATPGTLRGALWTLLVAADFFLVSNPLVFISSFEESLRDTVALTAAVALVTVPWLRLPAVPWLPLTFLGFAALSSRWSLSSDATWHAVGLYAVVLVVAMLLAANATVAVLVDGLTLGGVLIVAGSYYALREGLPGAAVPAGFGGFMSGVGTNRNILAYTLVLALAASLSVAPRSFVGWVARTACVALIVLNIALTHSSTGYVVASVVLVAALGIALYDATRRRWARAVVVLCLLGIAAFAASRAQTLLIRLGEDPRTVSGRVPLWHAILDEMGDGPRLLGYGWGAVWGHPWNPAPANAVLRRIQTQSIPNATHGHGSFFDVYPELGLIGVGLCALVYVGVAFTAVWLRRPATRSRAGLATSRFLLLGLIGHLALGVAEPLFTIPLGWFVLVLLVCSGPPAGRSLTR
jgi:hypothetical protein